MDSNENTPNFEVISKRPDDWADKTMIIYSHVTAQSEDGLAPNVVITRDAMGTGESFTDYVNRQLGVLQEQMPEFKLINRRKGKISAKTASDISCSWQSPLAKLQQRVVYISMGQGRIVCFVATARDDNFEDHISTFNEVLTSIGIEEI